MTLYDLQTYFQDIILENTALKKNIFENQSGLQIYRNNRMISLIRRLKNLYTTVQKIVGEDFFSGIAHQYISQHPSRASNLYNFGRDFSDFLSRFPPVKKLPYLFEVAGLEWACYEVYHEKNSRLFDLSRLQSISPETYGKIKFKLHPAARLMEFQYPVSDIWQLCQKGDNQNEIVDFNSGGEKTLIIRRQADVTFEKLSAGTFALLSAFNEGHVFESACTIALQTESDFNIESCLQEHLLLGTITDFSL